MKALNTYLSEYAVSHRNPVNIKIHSICVPLIMWSLVGFMHSFSLGIGDLKLSHPFVALALIYYALFKNWKVWMIMALVTVAMILSFDLVPNLRMVSLIVFVVGWIGQFYGHKVEGKKPSFFEDLAFLLIGPLWVLQKFWPKLFS